MTTNHENALLPTGLSDDLPPDAAFAAALRERLVGQFHAHGYDRVSPPLVEFEESLLAGTGAAMSAQTFRLMDPISQRMMGVRADMTPQVARLATTRLSHITRPLRLCYAGKVLRIKGSQLRPERQFDQAGAEIIGTTSPDADAEVIVMATNALNALGIKDISIDIGQPTLFTALAEDLSLPGELTAQLREALNGKDAAEVSRLSADLGEANHTLIKTLMRATGTLDHAREILRSLEFGPKASAERDKLIAVADRVRARSNVELTLDAVENRGFEYHSGTSFTLFAPGVRGELGNGGRYRAGQSDHEAGEPATGFSLFMDSILRAIDCEPANDKLFMPKGVTEDQAAEMREQGWRTVADVSEADIDAHEQARALGCGHILLNGKAEQVSA